MTTLLTCSEVDRWLRYPRGRSLRLAKDGRLPCVRLPDDEIRFDQTVIEQIAKTQHLRESEDRDHG